MAKYKLKKLTEAGIIRNAISSEYSLTQGEMIKLYKYLIAEYKRTNNPQFNTWANLIAGYMGHNYVRNAKRIYSAGKFLYKAFKK